MNDTEIVRELSRRTSLPEETTNAVWNAVHDLIDEGAIENGALQPRLVPRHVAPDDPNLVERLIAKAKKHPLGVEFLASGLLATVAITLGAHAFTVEAARRKLEREKQAEKNKKAKEEETLV